ncbi:hypothetical protein RhiJN_28810 [Ceratobasidium sp. AG-Ba]|nr:hypothetical protein RhiJN_14761 [Ceratobasidium sp. AG-Ba]QRW00792.1 hypothetical protein RhiJN_28810 [Ceratobasidium sp. AG-Ba]QRW15298.1 hypothetical protein RhiLY_14297 [Ceratobasidium sp. AG-Ba]
MSADLKAQSAVEHERWLARKAGDRQKGKRVPRCTCSWCVDQRVNAGRGRTGRIAVRVDDHETHGATLGGHDVEHELYMEAVRASTAPSYSPRSEVPLADLIRQPRSRRKVDILEDFEIIRPTRAVLALDDDGFNVSNRHVGHDDLEDWEDVGMVSEGKGPAKLVATSARSYAEVLLKA